MSLCHSDVVAISFDYFKVQMFVEYCLNNFRYISCDSFKTWFRLLKLIHLRLGMSDSDTMPKILDSIPV